MLTLIVSHVVLEDLANRLRQSRSGDQPEALAYVDLALPGISEDTPDLINALDRAIISPRQKDIAHLLETLEHALPVILRHIGRGGVCLNVAVRSDDPDAIPIAPHYLRRQFNEIPEQYHADVGF